METTELLRGTLEMLILKTLSRGPNHGYGIAQHIQGVSADALKIGEGSLYPALQRLLINEWVQAEWGVSENNRKARIYRLTPAGRKRLAEERRTFDALILSIGRVLEA
jgi:PadR family transcriptional regulator, regulatory protein PadR